MADVKANPGTLRVVQGRDSDGDPTWRVIDDSGERLDSGYCTRLWPGAWGRARRTGIRRAKRLARTYEQPSNVFEVVVNREKYHRFLEEQTDLAEDGMRTEARRM